MGFVLCRVVFCLLNNCIADFMGVICFCGCRVLFFGWNVQSDFLALMMIFEKLKEGC